MRELITDGGPPIFTSPDALTGKFPMLTPYQFASNTPIQAIDLDGLESVYYYSGNSFTGGFSVSKNISGPYSSKYLEKLGYVTMEQIHKVENQRDRDAHEAQRQDDADRMRKGIDAYNSIQISNNPGGLAIVLSPVKALYDANTMYEQGNTKMAAVTAAFAFTDFGPLFNTVGKGYTAVVGSFVEKFTIEETWQLFPRVRGIITEGRLAATMYKSFEWMAETSQWFRKFDFYEAKGELAVSLKTVNAEKDFTFKKIFTNIEELAELKKAGTSVQLGREFKIKDVRLDIAIPKGYNKANLQEVTNAANDAGVRLNIFEHY